MGYPRYLQVIPGAAGLYHCVSRCVRQAFLCGEDRLTGRSFEHRKEWLEDRILELADLFAVAVHAYAVMSNHFHLIVETDPTAPGRWSDEEVARRWLQLSRGGAARGEPAASRIAALTADSERLATLRERLGSLSWFMRYLKEPIARRANQEDGCSGRFWEGRFKTQALLDDRAVLACMVYVDLNPVRAGVAATPEAGPCTSLRRRVHARPEGGALLQPVAGSIPSQLTALSAQQYLALVDWTGRKLHPEKSGRIAASAPPILERLSMRPEQWLIQVPATESRYWRAIGSVESLLAGARQAGLRWIRGLGVARTLEGSTGTA